MKLDLLASEWPQILTSDFKSLAQITYYRVTLVVEYLGWVDLYLGCSAILLGQ